MQQLAGAFDTVGAAFGVVDVVVHTAGVMTLGPVADFDLDALDRMHHTNIRGRFVVAQQAARRVRAGGAIVTFSTSQTRLAHPGYAPYAASKAATEAMTLILAPSCADGTSPSTPSRPAPRQPPSSSMARSRRSSTASPRCPPLERLGTPADIAEAVAFLAGPGRWVNGQVLFGGIA
jgi:3-oxoacyl-[acyl-carrier protein] reductase